MMLAERKSVGGVRLAAAKSAGCYCLAEPVLLNSLDTNITHTTNNNGRVDTLLGFHKWFKVSAQPGVKKLIWVK